jgi:hypothetical protein
MTSFDPLTNEASITGTSPVTWKSGTHSMTHPGGPSVSIGAGPPRAAVTADRAANAISALSTARWVDTAPFGNPVVPDV